MPAVGTYDADSVPSTEHLSPEEEPQKMLREDKRLIPAAMERLFLFVRTLRRPAGIPSPRSDNATGGAEHPAVHVGQS